MSIPDYIVSQTIVEERRYRRVGERYRDDFPSPQIRRSDGRHQVKAIRCRLSSLLHAIADRIEPRQVIGCR